MTIRHGFDRIAQLFSRLVGCVLMAAILIALQSCGRKFEPDAPENQPCEKALRKSQRNGVEVVETVNGLFIRADAVGITRCGGSATTRHLLKTSDVILYWLDGGGTFSYQSGKEASHIYIEVVFPEKPNDARYRDVEFQDWWLTPRLPHKLYPIDLLPNLGLAAPDHNAGVGPLKGGTPRWAVRGPLNRFGRPFITNCAIKPPEDLKDGDMSYYTDPKWQLQGETFLDKFVAQTCQGVVDAANGKNLSAGLTVPGHALPEIDKVYKFASDWLSSIVVE